MKQPKDKSYLVKIAKRYFIDGISQLQLAEEFQVSRPTVSNLLKRCRREGIVEIRIAESDNSAGALADRLVGSFPVKQALTAALKTGIIDTIITDEHTAVKILMD